MKDSGVEWIGEVPDDWDVHKIKSYYSIVNGSTPKSDKSEYWGGDIIWITPAEMSPSIVEIYDSKRTITEDGLQSCGTTLLPINSIILSTRAPIGQVCIAGTNLCTNQGCKSLVMRKEFNYKYSYYYLSSQTVTLNMLGRGTTFMELSSYDLANYLLPIPPIPTQNRIASFLDTKCSLIDAAVQKEREIIEKLKEYRQAVITETVTKGIRAGVPMKDSEVEWIGEIPKHWNCVDFRRAVHLKQGLQIEQTKRFSDNGDNRFVYITLKYVNSNKKPEDTEYIENPDSNVMCGYDDILFVRTGATGLIVTNVFGVYHNNFFKIIFEKILLSKKYLIGYLSQKSIQAHFNLLAGTTTISDLNHGDFLSTKVLIPPLSEQQEIADYLDAKCSGIDATIQKRELAIEKLTAYKQSLIYECVTGKREVAG